MVYLFVAYYRPMKKVPPPPPLDRRPSRIGSRLIFARSKLYYNRLNVFFFGPTPFSN